MVSGILTRACGFYGPGGFDPYVDPNEESLQALMDANAQANAISSVLTFLGVLHPAMRAVTGVLKLLINTTDLSLQVYKYSKEYTRKYVDQAIYDYNTELRLSLVEQQMEEIKQLLVFYNRADTNYTKALQLYTAASSCRTMTEQFAGWRNGTTPDSSKYGRLQPYQAFPHIAATGSICLGVEALLFKLHPDWTGPRIFLGAMQDWQELAASAMRDIYADNTALPGRFAAMAQTLREHRGSLISLEEGVDSADKCLFYPPGQQQYRARDVKARTWTVFDNQTESAFRTAANAAPQYSQEVIRRETCSPRGHVDVVSEECPQAWSGDVGPDSRCGACSRWKDSSGDKRSYNGLVEAKTFATTMYNAIRERALNELPAKLEPYLAQIWSWQFFNPNNTASRNISQQLRMGPWGTAARATQAVLPRASFRPIAWDDDQGPRPLVGVTVFYAADAGEVGQTRIKGIYMAWEAVSWSRMPRIYTLSDCWGYCEGDLKQSWTATRVSQYLTRIEVAHNDRVRSIKLYLTGGVSVSAGPADGMCNGAGSARKVACSSFNSSLLLPANAFTNVTGQAEPAMNMLTLSGSVNTADRTIESLRVHYSVKRSAETSTGAQLPPHGKPRPH